jgi:cell division protein ZapA
MAGRTVELNVAGETCRVVTTASEEELQRFAAMVEEKLADVLQPGRPVTTKAMLLAAVALAHDAAEQRDRAEAVAARARDGLGGLLERVDHALERSDELEREREGRRRRNAGSQGESSKSAHHAMGSDDGDGAGDGP